MYHFYFLNQIQKLSIYKGSLCKFEAHLLSKCSDLSKPGEQDQKLHFFYISNANYKLPPYAGHSNLDSDFPEDLNSHSEVLE